MFRHDRKYFEVLSEKTLFQKDVLEKVYRLLDLLRLIYGDEFLGSRLVLKGGTAINMIYLNMPRLSVDLDFNYVSPGTRESMLYSREIIDKTLSKIFRSEGYEVDRFKPYALMQFNLKYKNTTGNIDRIKLEINFMERVPVYKIAEKGISIFDVHLKARTYEIEELFATKLRALFMRSASRDLFDVYCLLKNKIPFDELRLKKCFIFYFCLAGDFRKIDADVISGIDADDARKFLLPLLGKGVKMDMSDAFLALSGFAAKILALDPGEAKFVDGFYNGKSADLELLFGNVGYNPELKFHPMLEWRLKNSQ